ncbi:MAG: hypothetical protein CMM18_02895 [Rhodospirillaceae bacterium]|nr:hypothetical protein [Rhodospirillaceae bacterium]|tara:strand:- start:356 stop:577 length:222 start_codon:yes stop_codon:yes gene_type:complete
MKRSVDLRGLKCPIPVLRLKKELSREKAGSLIKVITSDPSSIKDFEIFCNKTGDQIIEKYITPNQFEFFIKKK